MSKRPTDFLRPPSPSRGWSACQKPQLCVVIRHFGIHHRACQGPRRLLSWLCDASEDPKRVSYAESLRRFRGGIRSKGEPNCPSFFSVFLIFLVHPVVRLKVNHVVACFARLISSPLLRLSNRFRHPISCLIPTKPSLSLSLSLHREKTLIPMRRYISSHHIVHHKVKG